MQITDFFKMIQEDIHSVVIATIDKENLPVTCVIDVMDYDEDGLYFLTARGKNFYERLKRQGYVALTGMKGRDTMHSFSASVRGKVREIGTERLEKLFQKNLYMNEIYPDKKSQSALTVFQIYKGTGELFDLSKKPIERKHFIFGGALDVESGYLVHDNCTGCGKCLTVCPQKCIDTTVQPVAINQNNCLHCGNCVATCPYHAIEKRG